MKNKLAALLLATTSFINGPLMAATELSGGEVDVKTSGQQEETVYLLGAETRPKALKNAVLHEYNKVAKMVEGWTFDGRESYNSGFIGEQKEILNRLLEAILRGEEFSVLDIGCGKNFLWGEKLASLINTTIGVMFRGRELPAIHIVGLTGGKNFGSEAGTKNPLVKGVCKIHVIDGAPLEFLGNELNAHESSIIPARYNAIVSASTMQHFADPANTLLDYLNRLKVDGIAIVEFPLIHLDIVKEGLPTSYADNTGTKCIHPNGLLIVWRLNDQPFVIEGAGYNPEIFSATLKQVLDLSFKTGGLYVKVGIPDKREDEIARSKERMRAKFAALPTPTY